MPNWTSQKHTRGRGSLPGCGMTDDAASGPIGRTRATGKKEQSSDILGHILEQCCPNDRVRVEVSQGCSLQYVFYLKNGIEIFLGQEIASMPLEKRQPSTGIRRGGIDSETAVSSRVGFMRHQMATVRATAWPPVLHLSMTQLPECGKLLMPNDALKVQ